MGRVRHARDGLVRVDEAPELFCGEEVRFSGGARGVVTALRPEVVLVDAFGLVREAEEVGGTGEPLQMWLGEPGGWVDPLGRPQDGSPPSGVRVPMQIRPLHLGQRNPRNVRFWTGSRQIDLLIGLRRGDSVAVLGPPGSGRSSLAMDAVKLQLREGARVVVAALGQEVEGVPALRHHLGAAGITWVSGLGRPLARRTMLGALILAESWAEAGEQVVLVIDEAERSSWFFAADRAGWTRAGGSLTVLVVTRMPPPADPPLQRQVVLNGDTHRIDLGRSRALGYTPDWRLLPHGGVALRLLLAERLMKEGCAGPKVNSACSEAERIWKALEQPPGVPLPMEEMLVDVVANLWQFRGPTAEKVRRMDPELLPAIRAAGCLKEPLTRRLYLTLRGKDGGEPPMP